MTTTPIYRKWVARIDSGTMTKAECSQFARVICPLAAGYQPLTRTNLTTEEARMLWDQIHDRGGVRLTTEHTEQGLAWLKSRTGRAMGLPANMLDKFAHFLYMGDADIFAPAGFHASGAPIWRIVTTDDQKIDYVARSWQSGGPNEWWWAIDSVTGDRA